MKRIEPLNTQLLLEAPLETLHRQSLEWLQEIEFNKDEIAFYYSLLAGKTPWIISHERPDELRSEKNQLIYTHVSLLDALKIEVEAHERFLAKMMNNIPLNEDAYRTRHIQLMKKMENFEEEFRQTKAEVFAFVKANTVKDEQH
jgi:hypothetical protein